MHKSLMFIAVASVFSTAVQAQTSLLTVQVQNLTINGVPYSENMVLPSIGKDASGNYKLTAQFSLAGPNGFTIGQHVFSLGNACSGRFTADRRPSDSGPVWTLDAPCIGMFDYTLNPLAGIYLVGLVGAGANASVPGANGVYNLPFTITPAMAAGSFTLFHGAPTMTSQSPVKGITAVTGVVSDACVYDTKTFLCPTTGKKNLFTVAGFGALLTGLPAKYTTSASGTLKSRVVSSKIRVDNPNYDQTGNLYVAAWIPSISQLYFLSSSGWTAWDGVTYPAYKENMTLTENDLGNVVSGYNLRSLVGAKLYVGFGKTGQETVQKGQFSMIHELVMEQSDRDEIAAEEAALAASVAAQKAKYDSCVTNGCEVKISIGPCCQPVSVEPISVPASATISRGSFSWTGTAAQWNCTKFCSIPNTSDFADKYTYTYNTTNGLWE